MIKLPIALGLYSVRGHLFKDLDGTLAAVREMGYDGVEFFGPMSTLPQVLNLSVYFRNMHLMAHYATHAIPVRNISKVIDNETWRNEFVKKLGQTKYNQITMWLADNANPKTGKNDFWDRVAGTVRQSRSSGTGLRPERSRPCSAPPRRWRICPMLRGATSRRHGTWRRASKSSPRQRRAESSA